MIILFSVCVLWVPSFNAVDEDTFPELMSPVYSDTCEYSDRYVRCGDQCIDKNANCQCGPDVFRPYTTTDHCCIPSPGTCTKENRGSIGNYLNPTDDGVCSEGVKLPMSTKCPDTEDQGRRDLSCYNSYEDSLDIGFRSHFTCPNTCVSVNYELCRGVIWCDSDVQQCGPSLRCRRDWEKHLLNTSLVKDHWYCAKFNSDDNVYEGEKVKNNGEFDSLDRADEEVASKQGTSYDIDPTPFKSCRKYSSAGLTCGPDEECKFNRFWCSEGSSFTCGEDKISNQDPRLCGNPLVLKDLECITYWPGPPGRAAVRYYGKKCIGTNQQCVVPWYTQGTTKYEGILSEKCLDKSDQIFYVGLTCREHLQMYIDEHDNHFCNIPPYHPSSKRGELVCQNKTKFFEQKGKALMDPHDCQSSCSDKSQGLDCKACTDSAYFICDSARNKTCLHPDLVCDGHPQCPGGEDEDLDKCHKNYRVNQIIEPFASLRCTSTLYHNLEIFATACNNKVECANGEDEADCDNNSITKTFLIGSTVTILTAFVLVRIIRRFMVKKPAMLKLNPPTIQQLLKRYENNIHDSDIIQEVNLYLQHVIYTKTVEETNNEFLLIFDFLALKQNYKESEMYLYLHNNLDPKLVQKMIRVKYPGLQDKIEIAIEKLVRRPIVTWTKDCINNSDLLKKIIQNISGLIKIEVKSIDMIKDFALTILMLRLVGGIPAIIDLPTTFGSVIVVVMFSSIIIPMLISSLHLAVNNFYMSLPLPHSTSNPSKIRKCLQTALLFILSPFQPVLLETHFLQTSEDARELAQRYNIDAIKKKQQSRAIKKQLIKFGRIELGRIPFHILAPVRAQEVTLYVRPPTLALDFGNRLFN